MSTAAAAGATERPGASKGLVIYYGEGGGGGAGLQNVRVGVSSFTPTKGFKAVSTWDS